MAELQKSKFCVLEEKILSKFRANCQLGPNCKKVNGPIYSAFLTMQPNLLLVSLSLLVQPDFL